MQKHRQAYSKYLKILFLFFVLSHSAYYKAHAGFNQRTLSEQDEESSRIFEEVSKIQFHAQVSRIIFSKHLTENDGSLDIIDRIRESFFKMGGLFNNLFSKNANCVKSLGQFSKEALKFIEETTEKECLKDGISDKEEIYNLKKEVMQKLLRGFTPDSDKISFDIYNDFSDFE